MQRKQDPSADDEARGAPTYEPARTGVELVEILRVRFHRPIPRQRAGQVEAVSHGVQQVFLEQAQRRRRARFRQGGQGGRVPVVERRMRILAWEETQEQFVHVERGHERTTLQARWQAGRLRPREAAEFTALSPGQEQWRKGLQQAAVRRARTTYAARHETEAPMLTAPDLQHPAGLAPGVLVNQVGGREGNPFGLHPSSNPRVASARASSDQFSRTLTHICRNTLRPNSRSISKRAARPTCFSRAPPCPITIDFCPSRSTQILAVMRSISPSSFSSSMVTPTE